MHLRLFELAKDYMNGTGRNSNQQQWWGSGYTALRCGTLAYWTFWAGEFWWNSNSRKVTLPSSLHPSSLKVKVHGIFQARILEWVAFPFSRVSSQPRDRTQVSCIAGGFFTSWATREACEADRKTFTQQMPSLNSEKWSILIYEDKGVPSRQVLLDSPKLLHLPCALCCCSVAQSCPTLCVPMDCSTPGFPGLHRLLELAQTPVHWVGDAIQPSRPLSSPSLLAFSLFQHQGLFQWVSSLHQVARILELQLHHQSFQWILRIDFF